MLAITFAEQCRAFIHYLTRHMSHVDQTVPSLFPDINLGVAEGPPKHADGVWHRHGANVRGSLGYGRLTRLISHGTFCSRL